MPGKSLTERAWDRHSADYQARHKIPTSYIHYGHFCPTEDDLQLLGEVKGKKVVELGCGGGQNSIAFSKRGANVIGVDLSEKQLAHARRLSASEGVNPMFLKTDITDLSAIPGNSTDIVFSAYAFQFVKNLKEALGEVYRILKDGGIFVFSLDHPFYACFPEGVSDLKVVRSYFNERSEVGDLGRVYPRSFSRMFNELFDAGFIVAKILEPEPPKKNSDEDRWVEYSLRNLKFVPGTIIFKVIKPHGFTDVFGRHEEVVLSDGET